MRRRWIVLLAFLPLLAALPAASAARPSPPVAISHLRVGVGSADATWHVGAGAGQYASKDPNLGGLLGGPVDPSGFSTTQRRSYGVQSRLTYRAIVVEGTNIDGSAGQRVALVKSDSYLAQDDLTRRAAEILAGGHSGIGHDQIILMASHNHSSPYTTTPSAGVWTFQDAFDLRAFEYHARQMAAAIEAAAADLRPARMGATVVEHRIYKGNIAGATLADDGTPAGYPDDYADFGISILRFDDVSGPTPKPLAVFANYGQHGESNDEYDLVSADFLGPLERFVERDIGAPLVFSQGDVGSSEGPYLRGTPDGAANDRLPDGTIRAWAHVGPAQTERGARLFADAIVAGWRQIGQGAGRVRFTSDFPVMAATRWVPGPLSQPYPAVSNCRTEPTVGGDPGVPVVGLPDCQRAGPTTPDEMVWQSLKLHGIPVPDNYGAPSVGALEENARLKLQVVRLGEVLLASCSCEPQMDLILNLESRIDDVQGNQRWGYDWGTLCTEAAAGTWACPVGGRTTTITDIEYRRMRAEVNNDAAGWDSQANAATANSEPLDPTKILGNFTHTELPKDLGYALPIGLGHTGDYNGYTVSYREFMGRDHYRKALTSYGPHTADYMNTRLMALAGELKGGPPLAPEPQDATAQADEVRQRTANAALGAASSQAYDSWRAALPDDAGPAAALAQPASITRFAAATFTWRGGSNAVDNPRVRVERERGDAWVPYAGQSGEVQTMVAYPEGVAGLVETYRGGQEWRWTANFEAFSAFPATVLRGGQVPVGTYRFVVDGALRGHGADSPYHLESAPFAVSPWAGVTATDIRRTPTEVSFAGVSAYPRTYTSAFPFVADDGRTLLCTTCSFRPWAAGADVVAARVTVVRAGGRTQRMVATRNADGRFVVLVTLGSGDRIALAPGDLRDSFGEQNGSEIVLVA